jgi:hypothetical protein
VLLRHPIVAIRIAGLMQRAWDRLRRRVVRLPDIGIVAFTAHSHEEALDLVRLRRWRILVAVVADQAITIAKPLAVVRAFGIGSDELSTWQVLIAYGLVRLVVALTPIPGGIGVTELGLAALLVRFGGDEAVVLAAVLTFRALTFALPIVTGGICFLAWRFDFGERSGDGPGHDHVADVYDLGIVHSPDGLVDGSRHNRVSQLAVHTLRLVWREVGNVGGLTRAYSSEQVYAHLRLQQDHRFHLLGHSTDLLDRLVVIGRAAVDVSRSEGRTKGRQHHVIAFHVSTLAH